MLAVLCSTRSLCRVGVVCLRVTFAWRATQVLQGCGRSHWWLVFGASRLMFRGGRAAELDEPAPGVAQQEADSGFVGLAERLSGCRSRYAPLSRSLCLGRAVVSSGQRCQVCK